MLQVCLAAPAAAAEVSAALDLSAGYDSNPLRIQGDGPGAVFGEAELRALVRESGGPWGWFVAARARRSLFEETARWAAETEGRIRAGGTVRLRPGRTRLHLAWGLYEEAERGTFTDRTTGAIFEVPEDPASAPGATVPIPDRFDHNTRGGFFELHWRTPAHLRLFFEGGLERVRYVEGYEATTTLEPLDHRRLVVAPGVGVRFAGIWEIETSVRLTRLHFDAQSALDAQGQPVPGTRRAYRYASYSLELHAHPGPFRATAGVMRTARDDIYAGYYDFRGTGGFAAFEQRLGPRTRLEAYASVLDIGYEQAVVPNDPEGDTRASRRRVWLARLERETAGPLGWFVEAAWEDVESEDPVFTYRRNWMAVGVRFGG